MALYTDVKALADSLHVGEIKTIDIPDKLKAFRKFLSEIGKNEHKKFATKIVNNELHIMRVNYFSVTAKLNAND